MYSERTMARFKNWVFNFFDKGTRAFLATRKYVFFIFEIIGWVIVLYFLTPFLGSLFNSMFGKNVQLSDFILLITAAFILAYTYEAKRLRDETIFQRKMAGANNIEFGMTGTYMDIHSEKSPFGKVTTPDSPNNVSQFTFLSGIAPSPTGTCSPFIRFRAESKFLEADYFIRSDEGKRAFLKTLEFLKGEIRASVLITNGTKFIYTFRATGENWKLALGGRENLQDTFILVKKELDYIN